MWRICRLPSGRVTATLARLGQTSQQDSQRVLHWRQRSPSHLAESQRMPFRAAASEIRAALGATQGAASPTTAWQNRVASEMPSTTVAGPRRVSPAV